MNKQTIMMGYYNVWNSGLFMGWSPNLTPPPPSIHNMLKLLKELRTIIQFILPKEGRGLILLNIMIGSYFSCHFPIVFKVLKVLIFLHIYRLIFFYMN